MPRRKTEQAEVIIPMLREVEVEPGRGKTDTEAVKKIGVTELPNDLLSRELLPSWHLLPSLGLHHQRFSL